MSPSSQNKREFIRQKRKDNQRRKRITFLLIVACVVILIVIAAFLPKVLLRRTRYQDSQGFTMGNPEAPVTVVQFSNYFCSHCKNFSENYEDDFIETFVETGKVFYQYMVIPSNSEQGIAGSEASYCAAEQNRFFEYKKLLFTYSSAQNAFSEANLVKYADYAGLDKAAFQACLESGKYADAYLADLEYSQSINIPGTPSFLVNGQLVTYPELIPMVESLLSE